MYAVIKTGGKQYRVTNGLKLKVEQIPADVGAEVTLDPVSYTHLDVYKRQPQCHRLRPGYWRI